jgi:hypothetical protein
MSDWQKAVEMFLDEWRGGRSATGALLCGSRATGCASEDSDVDLLILLPEQTPWREQGTRVVDGVTIEYAAQTPGSVEADMRQEFRLRFQVAATKICTGKVLFDRTGELGKLARQARAWIRKPYPRPGRRAVTAKVQQLCEQLEQLEACADSDAPAIPATYFDLLAELLDLYAQVTGLGRDAGFHTYQVLTDPSARQQYLRPDWPDADVARLTADAICETDRARMPQRARELTGTIIAAVLRRTQRARPAPSGKLELQKWVIWARAEKVARAARGRSPDVPFLYFQMLRRLFRAYAEFLGCPVAAGRQLHAYLTDARADRRHGLPSFPDAAFAKAYAPAMCETDTARMGERAEALARHVLDAMGGFRADGWRVRLPLRPGRQSLRSEQ